MALSFKIDKAKFKKEMDAFMGVVNEAFDSSFNEGGQEVVNNAKALSELGSISGSIQMEPVQNGFEVSTGNGMAQPELTAYYEFGTGNAAAVLVPGLPQDWQDMARRYFVNGKGILPAHPYLYPAFMKFKENIANAIISKI